MAGRARLIPGQAIEISKASGILGHLHAFCGWFLIYLAAVVAVVIVNLIYSQLDLLAELEFFERMHREAK